MRSNAKEKRGNKAENAEQYKKYGEMRQKMRENAKEKRGNEAENAGKCEKNAEKFAYVRKKQYLCSPFCVKPL